MIIITIIIIIITTIVSQAKESDIKPKKAQLVLSQERQKYSLALLISLFISAHNSDYNKTIFLKLSINCIRNKVQQIFNNSIDGNILARYGIAFECQVEIEIQILQILQT